MIEPEVIAAVGSLTTAAIGFFTGRHIRSGKVSTTDADRLWAEAGRLRADLTEELAAIRIEVHQKDERIQQLERENERLSGRVSELERELVTLRGNA